MQLREPAIRALLQEEGYRTARAEKRLVPKAGVRVPFRASVRIPRSASTPYPS